MHLEPEPLQGYWQPKGRDILNSDNILDTAQPEYEVKGSVLDSQSDLECIRERALEQRPLALSIVLICVYEVGISAIAVVHVDGCIPENIDPDILINILKGHFQVVRPTC